MILLILLTIVSSGKHKLNSSSMASSGSIRLTSPCHRRGYCMLEILLASEPLPSNPNILSLKKGPTNIFLVNEVENRPLCCLDENWGKIWTGSLNKYHCIEIIKFIIN